MPLILEYTSFRYTRQTRIQILFSSRVKPVGLLLLNTPMQLMMWVETCIWSVVPQLMYLTTPCLSLCHLQLRSKGGYNVSERVVGAAQFFILLLFHV